MMTDMTVREAIKEYGDTLNIASTAAIAKKGGIEAIIAAMEKHSAVANVQEAGCAALRHVESDDDGSVNIGDALPVLAWIFQRGAALADPFRVCGTDSVAGCREASPACQ